MVEWLDDDNPITICLLISVIVSKNINDLTITNKLLNLSVKLDNDHKVLGYYKIGHLAMSALLKLGMDRK